MDISPTHFSWGCYLKLLSRKYISLKAGKGNLSHMVDSNICHYLHLTCYSFPDYLQFCGITLVVKCMVIILEKKLHEFKSDFHTEVNLFKLCSFGGFKKLNLKVFSGFRCLSFIPHNKNGRLVYSVLHVHT